MDIKQLKFLIALDETRHFGQGAPRSALAEACFALFQQSSNKA